jgi:hypothetical protein
LVIPTALNEIAAMPAMMNGTRRGFGIRVFGSALFTSLSG